MGPTDSGQDGQSSRERGAEPLRPAAVGVRCTASGQLLSVSGPFPRLLGGQAVPAGRASWGYPEGVPVSTQSLEAAQPFLSHK